MFQQETVHADIIGLQDLLHIDIPAVRIPHQSDIGSVGNGSDLFILHQSKDVAVRHPLVGIVAIRIVFILRVIKLSVGDLIDRSAFRTGPLRLIRAETILKIQDSSAGVTDPDHLVRKSGVKQCFPTASAHPVGQILPVSLLKGKVCLAVGAKLVHLLVNVVVLRIAFLLCHFLSFRPGMILLSPQPEPILSDAPSL